MAKRKPDRASDIGGKNAIKPIRTKLKEIELKNAKRMNSLFHT